MQALILDALAASATKRDAGAYLKLFGERETYKKPQKISAEAYTAAGVNLGYFFAPARDAVENEPRNAQSGYVKQKLHIALVKIRAPQDIDDATLRGVLHTLEQLSQLGMQIVVVVDCDSDKIRADPVGIKNLAIEQADRIVEAVGSITGTKAKKVDGIISFISDNQEHQRDQIFIDSRMLLLSPLRSGKICVVMPHGYSIASAKIEPLLADEVIVTLTKEFAGFSTMQSQEDNNELGDRIQSLQNEVSLDRIIILDPLGGTPHLHRNRSHRYINLEQEYDDLMAMLSQYSNPQNISHVNNLLLMKSTLTFLPTSSSGFISTPSAVAKEDSNSQPDGKDPSVSTRAQRNPLVHNLLTNKSAVSSSLPQHRQDTSSSSPGNVSTLFQRGMPLTVIPEVPPGGWTCPALQQEGWMGSIESGLRNPKIDYQRLTYLINDSFRRTLDAKAYDERTRNSLAGIIIAGDYQGAAIFTWELPPSEYNVGGPSHPWVPYLDKFAVLRSAQGTATADILWNAMTRAFPQGFCWRSRTVNPVNKWYHDRSWGDLKLGGTQWTMFWTKKGIVINDKENKDGRPLLGVCKSVKPSWKDAQAMD